MRVYLLYLTILFLIVYSWRDWFKGLCGLILLMAVMHHPDMPYMMFGIRGLNVWNVLCANVALSWLAHRRYEGLRWNMPRRVLILLLIYVGVILIGVLRAVLDRSHIENYPLASLISEELINTVKWLLPGVLLFDGCRTRQRSLLAFGVILGLYCLIAAQVVHRVSWSAALSVDANAQAARGRQCEGIGYSADDTSAMLAGASWGMLAALPLVSKKRYRLIVLLAASVIAFGQALTGGRAGYVAWGATGFVLCVLKWRKHLLLVPVAVMLLPMILPGATARMLQGFGKIDVTGQATTDMHSVTSNRWLIWPDVVRKIGESSWVGHGRLAMRRTGLTEYLGDRYNDPFPHPHNMYLETLLDNGILGSLPIFLFWGMAIRHSIRLFRTNNHLYSAVGGLALSLMLAQFIAGMGAQHFYPLESTLGMWAAMFLALRVHVEEIRAKVGTAEMGDSGSRALVEEPAAVAATDVQGHFVYGPY